MTFKVPLGYHNKSKTYVSPINALKSDQYSCPKCNAILTLKHGEINAKHFAHKKTDDCTLDLVIHALAEQVIADNNNIVIEVDRVPYTNPRLEVVVDKRRADAIISTKEYPELLIEVTVTHGLTDQKLKEYAGYNVLEIDLSDLQLPFEMDTLKNLVLYNKDNRILMPK